MYLTLEVVSPQAASLGAERRKVVGPEGLTIGRIPGNGWVIPDPYISKQHARISFTGGRFFVEGVGRNPIALGRSENALGANQIHPLANGDRLFIDQYEIVVTVQQGEAPGAPVRPAPPVASIPVTDDPFALISDGAVRPAVPSQSAASSQSASSVIPSAWDNSVLQSPADTATLDPLAVMGGAPRPAPEPPPVNWQQASVLNDHLELPSVRATPGGIPTNWDQSVIVPVEPAPEPPPMRAEPPRPSPARPVTPRPVVQPRIPAGSPPGNGAAGSPPGNGAAGSTPGSGAAGAPLRPAAPGAFPGAASHQPITSNPATPSPRLDSTTPMLPPSYLQQIHAEPPRPPHHPPPHSMPLADLVSPPYATAPAQSIPPAHSTTPASAVAPSRPEGKPAQLSANFAELLKGAGLSERDISPEVLNELGQVLRVVVEGLMEVLRARSEIKSQFRLPLTRVKAAENNPLKLSPNVESALHTLLVQRNPGYLGTVPAFEDAFADIRSHQMAMLEGVRAAFQSMLDAFDPKQLEERFDAGAKRGGGNLLSSLGSKPKYWDLYKDRFAQLAEDPDDTFRRLFGDVFAEAYEKQLERLRVAGRDAGRK